MGDLHVDERNSPPVVSPEEMAGRFHGELIGSDARLETAAGRRSFPAGGVGARRA